MRGIRYTQLLNLLLWLNSFFGTRIRSFLILVNAIMPGWVLTKRQMDLWATEEGLSKHLDRQCQNTIRSDIVGVHYLHPAPPNDDLSGLS